MNKFTMMLVAAIAAMLSFGSVNTNVVTNVVYDTRVKWEAYPVTNGTYTVYGGTLVTNKTVGSVQSIWKGGKLVKSTNYVYTVTGGSTTSTVYDVEWRIRPEYYTVPITNVFTNVFVNGINVR